MADFHALRNDLESALKALPRELVGLLTQIAAKVITDHRAALEKALPTVLEKLKPHFMAIAMEHAMGTLDTKELETHVTAALANVANGVPTSLPAAVNG